MVPAADEPSSAPPLPSGFLQRLSSVPISPPYLLPTSPRDLKYEKYAFGFGPWKWSSLALLL